MKALGFKLNTGLFLQRHLPWRFAEALDRQNDAALRAKYREWLDDTPPVPAASAPKAEVHQLLGHRHIGMGTWSLKSLLRASEAPIGVVVHDDGSLSDEDLTFLARHIPGSRVIRRADADAQMREMLADLPACSSFRFGNVPVTNHRGQSYNMFIMALILFDIPLLADCDKVMILDADVLFFRRPDLIVDWVVEEDNVSSLYSVEGFRPIKQSDGTFRYDHKVARTLNSGLICMTKSQVYDLDQIEGWVGANPDLMYTSPVFEQLCYSYLIKPHPKSVELDPALYGFNYTTPDSVATHFGMKRGFYENLHRAERIICG
jgi:hypothetical protein